MLLRFLARRVGRTRCSRVARAHWSGSFAKAAICERRRRRRSANSLKYERNQVAAVTKSREQWRSKAQQSASEAVAREQELEALRRANQCLEDATSRTGVPRAIVDDHGADLEFTRIDGVFAGAGEILAKQLPSATDPGGNMARQLVEFVTEQSAAAKRCEQLPASTEVLESCFGKLKSLEQEQSKSGFTGMVLSLGAIVASSLQPERIQEALERCRVKDVLNWCRTQLGPSIQRQRCLAYATSSAQQK